MRRMASYSSTAISTRPSAAPSRGPKLLHRGRAQMRLHFLGLGIASPPFPAYAIYYSIFLAYVNNLFLSLTAC